MITVMNGYEYEDTREKVLNKYEGGILYSKEITTNPIPKGTYNKIIVEIDAYVDSGEKLIIVNIKDENNNTIESGGSLIRNTELKTIRFEFLIEKTTNDVVYKKYNIEVITMPVFSTGTLHTTRFKVIW